MSLTASMWTSVSGLLVHGEKMNVIGNNISNVNTVGFKGARMDFEDFVSQYVGTAAGMGQVGRGTRIGIVMNNFVQGSFETTTETTDIAIAGNGFFCVKPKNDNTSYYTRAGNFRFDKDGYLTDPHGYVLQGWGIDNTSRSLMASTGASATGGSRIIGTGTPQDVKLDTFSCDPKHTNHMTLDVNLDSGSGNDKCINEDFPFFSLLNTWDATPNTLGEVTPLGSQTYAYSQPIEVFDEGGQSHKLTIYFDRVEQTVNTNIQNMKQNEIVWEYVVTMDPTEDMRNFSNPPSPGGAVPDKYKGLLMSGTLVFDSSGQIKDQTAYVPTSQDMGNMANWKESPISANGFPVFAPNFSGRDGASTAWDPSGTQINKNADGYLIEMNLGLRSKTPYWSGNSPATINAWTTPTGTDKVEHAPNGTSPGTYISGIGEFQSETGVVGANNVIYYQKDTAAGDTVTTPGEVLDTANINGNGATKIYTQKATSAGLGANEADGGNGYVYKQQQQGGQYVYNSSGSGATPGYTYRYNTSTLEYEEYNGYPGTATGINYTAAQLASSNIVVTARPDTTQPVISATPAASTREVPKCYPGTNTPIPGTQTFNYYGMQNTAEKQNNASTSYTNNKGNNFYERFASQDGYTYGELRYVTVSQDGVLSAAYSNGVTLELFQLTLYDFPSKQNLRREGGNLFTETRASGLPTSGAAGTGSFGTTESNSLEQSNVDLATEFVQMITTQRGFQANSKSITTVDTMLETVIQMKR